MVILLNCNDSDCFHLNDLSDFPFSGNCAKIKSSLDLDISSIPASFLNLWVRSPGRSPFNFRQLLLQLEFLLNLPQHLRALSIAIIVHILNSYVKIKWNKTPGWPPPGYFPPFNLIKMSFCKENAFLQQIHHILFYQKVFRFFRKRNHFSGQKMPFENYYHFICILAQICYFSPIQNLSSFFFKKYNKFRSENRFQKILP